MVEDQLLTSIWIYRKFFKEWDVKHDITSSHFPKEKEQTETTENTIKHYFSKAAEEGKALCCIVGLQNKTCKTLASKGELLMGRKLIFFLPSYPEEMRPQFNFEYAKIPLNKRRISQNKYANKHATFLPELHNYTKM